jgi:hypothetical protein
MIDRVNYRAYFAEALDRLHSERRYRVFADLERIAGRFPHATWHSPAGPKNVVSGARTTTSAWASIRKSSTPWWRPRPGWAPAPAIIRWSS